MTLRLRGLAALCLATVVMLSAPLVAEAAPESTVDVLAAADTAADEPSGGTSSPVRLGNTAVPLAIAALPGAETASSETVTGEIVGASPAVVQPSSTLRLTVELQNGTEKAVVGEELHVRVTAEPLRSQEALEAFLADPAAFARTTVASTPFGAGGRLPAGASDTASIAIPASALGLPVSTWGVYGLSVTRVDAAGATTLDALVLTWTDTAMPSLSVNVTATVAGSSMRAESVLAAATDSRVTLLVDPLLVTQDSVAEHEAYRVPAGDVDLTSLAHAGDTRLLDVALASASAPSDEVVATLPWIAPVAVADESTLAAAAGAGATAAILEPHFASESLTGAADATVAQVETGSGSIAVIQPDTTLSSTVGSYRTGSPTATFRLVAESALIAASGETDPVVIAPGQTWMIDTSATASAIATLFSAPWVTPVPLAAVLSDTGRAEAAAASGDTEDDLSRPDVVRLGNAMDNVAVVASAAEDSRSVLTAHAEEILPAVSLTSRATPHSREALVANAIDSATETANAVSIATSSELNLIAAEGFLPITVRNALDQPVTVRVVVSSSSVNLRVEDEPEAVIPAGGEMAVQVPFSAVSTANVDISARVVTLEGEQLAPPQTLTVRVRADWGNAATLVFSVLLVLLLVAGVLRTVRRGRRDTRVGPSKALAESQAVASNEPDTAETSAPDEGAASGTTVHTAVDDPDADAHGDESGADDTEQASEDDETADSAAREDGSRDGDR